MPRTRKNPKWSFTRMKLLFDQNLSDQLVTRLSELFPNSIHAKTIGLNTAADTELWDYARKNNYLIVSKHTDFSNRSIVHGHPPKVIWLRLGNYPTSAVEDSLRNHYSDIRRFTKDPNRGLLMLLLPPART